MHPELVEGRTFWSGSRPSVGPRRLDLDGTDEGGGGQILRIARSGVAASGSDRKSRNGCCGSGDSEKTSTTSVRWEKLPS
jgi:hypothetical protein